MLYENILDQDNLKLLTDAVLYELKNFPCLMVPKYQTYPTMHRKYRYYAFWQHFQRQILELCKEEFGKNYRIHSCWFNACKQESNFDWHTHTGYDLTCVFYLLNCDGNGTLVKENSKIIQTPAKDNSLGFMDIGVEHKVPEWDGRDRYSIAIQLVEIKD